MLNLLNDVKSDGQLCDKTAVNKLAIQILLHCKIVNIDIILNILRSLALSNFGSSFAEGGGHQNEQKVCSTCSCVLVTCDKELIILYMHVP